MSRRAGNLSLLVAVLLLSTAALEAGTAADLRGKVSDRQGQPLPGATVTVRNGSIAFGDQGTVTDPEGNFRIFRLPPGTGYRVRVTLPTYAPVEFTDIELTAGQTYTLDVVLRQASELQETIRVKGHTDLVNTESVVTSTTFSSEFMAGLPVLGRDYQDVLSLAPGVTDVNGTGNPNIHGARDTDVITLVDGMNTTDPLTGYYGQQLNIESIEQIEVITSGATAEFSRAQGGFANIITKSGSNDFQGSFKLFVRSYRLDGDGAGIDPPDLRGGLGENHELRQLSFTDLYPFLSLSGPFVRDKVWYYLANEYVQVETPINAVTQAFVTRTTGYREFGKVSWQINQAHKLAFSISLDNTKDENQGLNSNTDINSGYSFARGGPTYTLKETAVFNPTYLLESSVSWFDNGFQRTPTLDPDTNHNGILFVDNRPELGGNQDGLLQASERDPGEDYDRDHAFDIFEDYNRNHVLDQFEDQDDDGRVTPPMGCEGAHHEDVNCNGLLDQEFDLNQNGKVDPFEDVGIPGIDGTAGNHKFDSEDVNKNNVLDTVGDSGPTSFPFYEDRNGNHRRDPGEWLQPIEGDLDFTRDAASGRIAGPNPYQFEDQRQRFTVREDFSVYLDNAGGSHDLKTGLIYEHEAFDRDTQLRPALEFNSGKGASFVSGPPRGATVLVHLPTIPEVNNTATGKNFGLYLQDTYKPVPNVTVGVGLRVDFEDLSSFGHTTFDPREERAQFNTLMVVTDIEKQTGGDWNFDGIRQMGLGNTDPLYSSASVVPSDPLRISNLYNELKTIAPRRMTRHEYITEVHANYLASVTGRNVDFQTLLEDGYNPRRPDDIRIQNTNIAPRLSLTWDPWADGKSKGFAAWNRFYDKLFLNTIVLEEGPDTVTRDYSFDPDGVSPTGLPDNQIGLGRSFAPPTAFQVDRGLSTPYTDEFTLGFQRELAPEYSLSITYIHRNYHNQLQDIDINHDTRIDPFTGKLADRFGIEQSPAGQGGDIPGVGQRFPDGRPDLYIENFFFNRVFRLGNYNEQTYRGLELELVRRLSRKWQLEGSYTYSRSAGDAESFNSENGDDPSLVEFESGYLNYDQRHVVKLNGIAYLPGDWQIGGTAQWASGLPYSYLEEFSAYDNVGYVQSRKVYGRVGETGFQQEHRNIHRNPAAYLFNVRAKKSFVLGKSTAAAFFEVYNLLNADNLRVFTIDASRFANQADEQRAFGRRFQLGVQIDF